MSNAGGVGQIVRNPLESRIVLVVIDVVRQLGWFICMAKVAVQGSVATAVDIPETGLTNMYPWVEFTLVMSSFLIAQRFFNQLYLSVNAIHGCPGGEWNGGLGTFCKNVNPLFIPVSLIFLPLAACMGKAYSIKYKGMGPNEKERAKDPIVANRRSSTALLGVPLYSTIAMAFLDHNLIVHPMIAKFRLFELGCSMGLELVCFITIDFIVFLYTEDKSSCYLYAASSIYSLGAWFCIMCFAPCYFTYSEETTVSQKIKAEEAQKAKDKNLSVSSDL